MMTTKSQLSAGVRRLRPYLLAAVIAAASGLLYPLFHGIFSFSLSLGGAALACLITFSLVGFETFVYEKRLRKMSITKALAIRATVYSSTLAIAYLLLSWVARYRDPEHASSITFQSLFVFAAVASVTVSSFVTVSHILGQHELIRLILGRYHQPREEQRILLFIDLAGSTTIAEKIGGVPFFNLLNDFFRDLSSPILSQGGEIYKYVGDEVIISWPLKSRAGNSRALRCYFEVVEELKNREQHYLDSYGVCPKFRAGAHLGTVVVGELGDFKKEIAFLGDSVNTTARIISEAAAREKGLLISASLRDCLTEKEGAQFDFEALGEIPLKGKSEVVPLFGVKPREQVSASRWWPLKRFDISKAA